MISFTFNFITMKPLTIDKIGAFVSVINGEEGIISLMMDGAVRPFVFSDMERFNQLLPIVKSICAQHGKEFRILIFLTRRDITVEILAGTPIEKLFQ